MDFGKELPWEYISCIFEWLDSLEVKVVVHLKGRMSLDSLESHQLEQPPGLDFAKFNVTPYLRWNIATHSYTLLRRRRQIDIAWITGVTQSY